MRLLKLRKDKRGVLGLEVVKAVMIAFLAIAVIAIALLLVMTTLDDSQAIRERKNEVLVNGTLSGTLANTTAAVDFLNATLDSIVCSNVVLTNATANTVEIDIGNYTVDECSVQGTAAASEDVYANVTLNVSYSYSYDFNNAEGIKENVTAGVTEFFNDTGTIFAILAVVVVILAIAIIIVVVGRFGGPSIVS